MNEEQLIETWTAIAPSVDERRRIDRQVEAWLDAHDTSVAAEWLGLFRIAPIPAVGLVTASTVAMVVASMPLFWFAQAVLAVTVR